MIIRVVKLSFDKSNLPEAIQKLEAIAPVVRSMNGCRNLEIGFRLKDRGVVFTYSHWDSVDHLNDYRDSSTFRDFWDDIKSLFSNPAEAYSLEPIFSSDKSLD